MMTAIGRMGDLIRFNDIDDVDTWWKSGRIPEPGEPNVTWQENQHWLDERVQRGDDFVIVSDPSTRGTWTPDVPNGSFTLLELQYLENLGVSVYHSY